MKIKNSVNKKMNVPTFMIKLHIFISYSKRKKAESARNFYLKKKFIQICFKNNYIKMYFTASWVLK